MNAEPKPQPQRNQWGESPTPTNRKGDRMDNQENYDVLNFAYLFSDTMQMVREETTEHLGRETPRVMLTRSHTRRSGKAARGPS